MVVLIVKVHCFFRLLVTTMSFRKKTSSGATTQGDLLKPPTKSHRLVSPSKSAGYVGNSGGDVNGNGRHHDAPSPMPSPPSSLKDQSFTQEMVSTPCLNLLLAFQISVAFYSTFDNLSVSSLISLAWVAFNLLTGFILLLHTRAIP